MLTLGRGLQPDPAVLRKPERILAVRLDHLGDMLFIRPALQALKNKFPSSRITVLTSAAGARLLEQDPWVDEIITWEAPWFARHKLSPQPGFFRLARLLRSRQFDLALEFRGDIRHLVLLWLAGVRVRAGYDVTGGGFLLHLPLKLPVGLHEVERNLAVAAAVGAGAGPGKYPQLTLTDAEKKAGAAVWSGTGPKVVIHPSAGNPAKRWPATQCAQVCDTLRQAACQVLLVGTEADRPLATEIIRACQHPPRDLTGNTPLRVLAAILGEADLVIGTDSGPAHLAVTQDAPVVMLWSETNEPEEWGPWGQGVRASLIRNPWRPEATKEIIRAALDLLAGNKEQDIKKLC
jgi:heptosyltransferase-2/heptosyltransferase-3